MCQKEGFSIFPAASTASFNTNATSSKAADAEPFLSSAASETDLKPTRLKIWHIRASTHCSVIGTCLTERDLKTILKKCGLQFDDTAEPYQIHSYVVKAVCKKGPIGSAVQKLLDRRHAGILRIFGRTKTAEDLEALWEREYRAGRLAGAFWAVQTYSHVPDELFSKIFGEVHMLSHVLGRTVHAEAERASELAAQVADLVAKVARSREQHQRSLEVRDTEIDQLRSTLEKGETEQLIPLVSMIYSFSAQPVP